MEVSATVAPQLPPPQLAPPQLPLTQLPLTQLPQPMDLSKPSTKANLEAAFGGESMANRK